VYVHSSLKARGGGCAWLSSVICATSLVDRGHAIDQGDQSGLSGSQHQRKPRNQLGLVSPQAMPASA
jgi:hypothetical protein